MQADLIISLFRSDIGVPYRSQGQPTEVFNKKAVLKSFAILTGKHLFWSLFLIKLQALGSCQYCKIFQSTYFEEPLRTAASKKNVIPVTDSD